MTHSTDSSTDSHSRRRFLQATGAASSAAAVGLAGCSGGGGKNKAKKDGGSQGASKGSPTPAKEELTFWFSFITEQGEPARQLAEEWRKSYEKDANVDITIKGVPYAQLTKQFRAAQAGGNPPHTVEVLTNPVIMTEGTGMRVNDYFDGSYTQEVIGDSILELNKVWGAQATGEEGNLLTWPLSFQPFIPVWRTDWLEQAGYSREDVDHTAGSLKWYGDMDQIFKDMQNTELGQKKGNFPSATGMKQSDMEYQALYSGQFGGSLSGTVNEAGTKAAINSKGAVKAYEMQKEFIEKGYFDNNSINMGDEEATTKHWNGQIGENHIQDMSDLWAVYQQEKPDMWKNREWVFGQSLTGTQQSTLTWLWSIGFIEDAFDNERQKELATGAFDYWVKNFSNRQTKAIGRSPVDPETIKTGDWFAQSEIHKDFWRGSVVKTLENGKFGTIPAVPGADAITYDIPRQMWVRILQEDMPIQKAADKAAKEINDLLAQKGRK